MIRCTIALAVTVVATLCGCASLQPPAETGDPLRTHNFLVSQMYAVPHGQMFSMRAAALQAEGYIVERRDSAETKGQLVTEPRFTAPSCLKAEVRAEVEQLGLGLVVAARTISKHDSTEVGVMSVVVRRSPIAASQRDRADELDGVLRICGSAMVGVRLDSLAGGPK